MNSAPVFCARCQPHVNKVVHEAQAEQRREVYEQILREIERCPDFKEAIIDRIWCLRDPGANLKQESK